MIGLPISPALLLYVIIITAVVEGLKEIPYLKQYRKQMPLISAAAGILVCLFIMPTGVSALAKAGGGMLLGFASGGMYSSLKMVFGWAKNYM